MKPSHSMPSSTMSIPVVEGVAPSDLVAGWGEFERDKTPLTDIAKRRPDALRLTEEIDFDG